MTMAGHPTRRPAASQRQAAARAGRTAIPSSMPASRSVRSGCILDRGRHGVVLGMWSAATATYFAFRDDVLTRLIARQAEMQYAYEDRIAELRAKIDRTTSRQMLDQEQFDQKLEQIMRRQTTLESRATALGAIPDPRSRDRSDRRREAPRRAKPASPAKPKPSPISDTVIFVAPPDREARLESRAPDRRQHASRANLPRSGRR